MSNNSMYILVAIFGLVVAMLFGLSLMGAPEYPAGYQSAQQGSK